MNATKIEWCFGRNGEQGYTWNPITGCTLGCAYCYARAMARRFGGGDFKPTFHPERLHEPERRKKPARIFVCSMGDFFDPGVPDGWRYLVERACLRAPQHTYLFTTKRHEALKQWAWAPIPNLWIGATATDQRTTRSAISATWIVTAHRCVRWVNFEPVLGPITEINGCPHWAVVGLQTPRPAPRPLRMTDTWRHVYLRQEQWAADLVHLLRAQGVPTFVKDSLAAVRPDVAGRDMP